MRLQSTMNLEFRKSLRRKKSSTVLPPSVERDINAEISLKGWLYRLEGSPLKHWKKRWCVLAQYALFVYKDEDEQKLQASLRLPGYNVRVCTGHDKVSHKNAFVAEHEQMKSLYFAADSNAAMCQWRNSMAQAATVQISQPEHISPPSQAVYEKDYGRYLAMTCVTRSPIYANAPPKPKRLSPSSGRPKSADFLNEEHPQCRPEVRPHTGMNIFDPHWGVPAHPLRPKSCLAESMFSDVSHRSSPTKLIESAQDIYAALQPQVLHPAPVGISNGGFISPSTSVSSTSPPSSNHHANFHSSFACYSPPQANFNSLVHSCGSLSRPPTKHRHLQQQQQQQRHRQHKQQQQQQQTSFRPEISQSTGDLMLVRTSLRVASSPNKSTWEATFPFANAVTDLNEIQPSKLEMFRQLPHSYSYLSTPSYASLNDSSFHSSRDLHPLQSLTDSQYSMGPPESSLPSLESNSDMLVVSPPVQNFTNVPPPQLKTQPAYSPKFDGKPSPPRYSEACLRSEIAQKINSTETGGNYFNRQSPETPSQLQYVAVSTPSRLTNKSNRHLLLSKTTCSPIKASLTEKNQSDDPYSYGREDLLKASQIFYSQSSKGTGYQPVGTILDSRHMNSLDISFQSSSHNSVFEHDRDAVPTTMLPIMSQMDRTSYAILKQEIEGSKVLDTNNDSNSRNCFHSVSESVSSTNSQNSVIRNKFSQRLSPQGLAKTPHEQYESARQSTVSEKLAFFEAKTSPEPLRPRSRHSHLIANNSSSSSSNNNNNHNNNRSKVPDLIDELQESHSNIRANSNHVTTASSEDILKTITAKKHQRSLSLLEGAAPDVVPTQSPPYYYSDLSLSARDGSRASLREATERSAREHDSNQKMCSKKKTSKSQSCENLLKKQSLKLAEITQSASCLLDCEPFYENIGFGCKSSAVKGPEPQSSPAKISFLAVSSTKAKKTASVGELITASESSLDSVQSKSAVARHLCAFIDNSSSASSLLMESLDPPDLVQSTLDSSTGDNGNEIFAQIINSIKRPSKINIPERYISDSDSEADFSAVERLARFHKADTIRRRIAGQSRDRANKLSVNQVIAKQAKHVSKIVAAQL